MYEWRDKVVLITGAANGIGERMVRLALEEGAKHVSILDVDESAGGTLANDINSKYEFNKTEFCHCDVTNDDQLFAAFSSVAKDHGNIDVVINNAGIMNDSLYKKEIAINVTALITSTLKSVEMMRVDKGGCGGTVINVASTAGLHTASLLPIYSSTKASVIHFSNSIGGNDFFTKTGVRVLTVCFGATDTSLFAVSKIGSYDHNLTPDFLYATLCKKHTFQTTESAARGLIETYKHGKSGSTWLVSGDLPARDITQNVAWLHQTLIHPGSENLAM